MARPNRSKRRKAVRTFVHERDFQKLLEWARRENDAAFMVVALVFDRDDTLRWRAIEALGELSAAIAAEGDVEKVRGIIRRLLWLMNDESGGIAWHGPEAIAEVLDRVPQLQGEYGRIVASFIDEPPFGPGVHRAIAKLAASAPDQFEHVRERLGKSPDSDDPNERGFSLIALSTLAPRLARAAAKRLVDDMTTISEYDRSDGTLKSITVRDLARQVLGPDSSDGAHDAPERDHRPVLHATNAA